MNKIKRHKAIKEVVKNEKITSQKSLQKKLEEKGYSTTQATLSRDLNALRIIKIPDDEKGHIYGLPEEINNNHNTIHSKFPVESFHSITFSGNLAVIKCNISFASSIALLIDEMRLDEVLGTIAGDDTVFIALREGITEDKFLKVLTDEVPEIKDHL